LTFPALNYNGAKLPFLGNKNILSSTVNTAFNFVRIYRRIVQKAGSPGFALFPQIGSFAETQVCDKAEEILRELSADDKTRRLVANHLNSVVEIITGCLQRNFSSDVERFYLICPVSQAPCTRISTLVQTLHEKYVSPCRARREELLAALREYITRPMRSGEIEQRLDEIIRGAQDLRLRSIKVADTDTSESVRSSVLASQDNTAVRIWFSGDNIVRLENLHGCEVLRELIPIEHRLQDTHTARHEDSQRQRRAIKTSTALATTSNQTIAEAATYEEWKALPSTAKKAQMVMSVERGWRISIKDGKK
jgi:hypothetical protein